MRTPVRKTSMIVILLLVLISCAASAQTYDGYTLYGKMGNNTVYLVDMNHNTYHTWTNSVQTGYSVYLLPNQHILRAAQYNNNQMQGAAMCGMVQDMDWSGTVTWQYVYSTSTYCSHHDIHSMPNGNVLLISYEVKTAAQVTAAGGAQSIEMWPDKILEIQPSGSTGGTVVWEWHVWDHLIQDHDASKSNYGVVANHPELLNLNYLQQKDWMHTNGIDYNPELDQIVISTHNLNELYVIDHSTTTAEAATHTGGNSGKGGDFLYRWGNPAAYNQGNTSNQVFHIPHDAHWIAQGLPWATCLVVFNNRGINNTSSCVDRIIPPYNGYNYTYTSGAYGPSTYSWRHACLQNAQDQSSSQMLPNGNTLVDISSSGYIYEIDSTQALLWSMTVGGTVAKAFRYSPCYVNGGITVTAAADPTSVCAGGSSQLTATASGGSGYTYSWTSNPSGFTSTSQNPIVNPAVTTTYIVNVTSGSCTAVDSVTVTVEAQPTVTAYASPTSVCPGSGTQLNAVPTGTGPYSYAWSSIPAGFTSTQQNPIAYPTVNTIYIVGISSTGGCTASDSVSVTVLPVPSKPVITVSNDTLFSSSATGNQWYLDGTAIPGATNRYYKVTQNGTYTVRVTGTNGCVSEFSDPLIWVGVENLNGDTENLIIFPNPTSGTVTAFSALSIPSNLSLSVFDLFGRMLLQRNNSCTIDLSALSDGMYILVLGSGESILARQRIIVQK